jgi:hypothetical protein
MALISDLFDARGVVAGGLASYGINSDENYRQTAVYVAKILKGTPSGDLSIVVPTKIELVINLKTAKMLGLTIPSALRDRADERGNELPPSDVDCHYSSRQDHTCCSVGQEYHAPIGRSGPTEDDRRGGFWGVLLPRLQSGGATVHDP